MTVAAKPEVAPSPEATEPRDWPRIRFAASLAIYAGALGASTILVNLLTRFEDFQVPEHLSIVESLIFGTAGALSGIVFTAPLAYWLFGSLPRFHRLEHRRRPRGIFTWTMLGFGYGVMLPLVMGGFFLPLIQHFQLFYDGFVSVPGLWSRGADQFAGLWATFAVFIGFRLLFTGLIAGVLFAAGAWIIDRLNLSASPKTAKYGSWAMAVTLSVLIIAFVALASESVLSNLG